MGLSAGLEKVRALVAAMPARDGLSEGHPRGEPAPRQPACRIRLALLHKVGCAIERMFEPRHGEEEQRDQKGRTWRGRPMRVFRVSKQPLMMICPVVRGAAGAWMNWT